ncbi:MAG: class I SAM-dependent methyltransferase [Planctomycetota bacterium]
MILRAIRKLYVNSSRVYLEQFCKRAGEATADGAMLLDAGCGEAPYRKFFGHTKYESADFCQVDKPYFNQLTYVCSLDEIPVEDERFDTVVMTQVLEHIPKPRDVLAEISRVMKPGGQLWISAPLAYPEHEVPYDFFRYTQFAWKMLCEEADLEIEELEWLEGYAGTLAFQFDYAARHMPWRPESRVVSWFAAPVLYLTRIWLTILAAYFSRMDLKTKITSKGHCKNYALVLRKKQIEQSDGDANEAVPS